jgi:hypothetical protein
MDGKPFQDPVAGINFGARRIPSGELEARRGIGDVV